MTIGSDLARPGAASVNGDFTFTQFSLPAGQAAPGGVVSPVNGVVTLARFHMGPSPAGPVAIQVVRPFGVPGVFTGAGTSAAIPLTPGAVSVAATQLPISIGDHVGVVYNAPADSPRLLRADSGSAAGCWRPPLADGGAGRAPSGCGGLNLALELTINADIEPTSQFAVSAVTALKRGSLSVKTTVPNPGTLTAGAATDPALASASATSAKKKKKNEKKKKRKLLLAPVSSAVSDPGNVELLVAPTKAARGLLKEKKRLKTQLKLVFTPTGGSPSAQVIETTLKR